MRTAHITGQSRFLRPLMRPTPLALLLSVGFASCLSAQAAPTTIMLKRIAEAVDGNRSGKEVYVVLTGDPLNPPAGVFPELTAATAVAKSLGRGARVFGPYQTTPEPGDGVAACIHVTDSRYYTGRCAPPTRFTPRDDIRTMSLMITRKDGSRDSIQVPIDADALFLSPAAIDKFVVPYYTRVIGVAAAAALRTESVRSFVAGPQGKD
ncbi:MAG: hypothetical protein U0132_15765 [Gemmatimonadaceae bacterium]